MKYNRYREEQNREDEERVKLNPFQLCYFIYTAIYLTFCFDRWKSFGMVLDPHSFVILSVIALIFTAAVLLYNRKYEKRAVCRAACYIIAALAVLSFIVYLW